MRLQFFSHPISYCIVSILVTMCFAVYFQVDKQVAQNAQIAMMYVVGEELRVSIS